MSTSIELYARIGDYLDGRVTLPQLEAWIAPRLRAMLSESQTDVADAVGAVELCLAEIAAGVRSSRSAKTFIRKHLGDQLSKRVIYAAAYGLDAPVISGSNSQLVATPRQ